MTAAAQATAPRRAARRARMRRRHGFLVLSFLIMVLAPLGVVIWYLNERAEDQFASEMAFSIRSEEFVNPLETLNGLGQLSTGTTADAEVVYEFIGSQKI